MYFVFKLVFFRYNFVETPLSADVHQNELHLNRTGLLSLELI